MLHLRQRDKRMGQQPLSCENGRQVLSGVQLLRGTSRKGKTIKTSRQFLTYKQYDNNE